MVSARSLFDIHNPLGTKLITRLRVGLSHLRAHKYSHKFQDTLHPNCPCGNNEKETVEHYLLYCPDYAAPRQHLFDSLRKSTNLVTFVNTKYICDLLLYGDSKYTWNTNKEILKATIKFVISSKRFDNPLIES